MSSGVRSTPDAAGRIRVVVVDDSRLMREFLSVVLNRAKDITVVGTAASSNEARQLIRQISPDVVTLDIQMPEMDGVEFLRRIMKMRPMPVVMVTGQSQSQAMLALKTLEIGAVGLVTKPNGSTEHKDFPKLLCDMVRTASLARFDRRWSNPRILALPDRVLDRTPTVGDSGTIARPLSHCKLVAVGASTGGVMAITRFLEILKPAAPQPPIVITLHMPKDFTDSFAKRLAQDFDCDIAEARDGEFLEPGMVRIAPGGRHLRVKRDAGRMATEIGDDAPINNHRPSVDALFSSIATVLTGRAVGVILTGMGSDGARGLLDMRDAGAYTLGEAESSCTIYGMPAAAKQIGAVAVELDIKELGKHLRQRL